MEKSEKRVSELEDKSTGIIQYLKEKEESWGEGGAGNTLRTQWSSITSSNIRASSILKGEGDGVKKT